MTPEELDQYFLETTAEIMTDHSDKMAEFKMVDWWLMLSSIQYTWRDENLSKPMRDALRLIGGNLAKLIIGRHPDAKMLIEAGWDQSLDRYPSSSESRDDAIAFLKGMYGLDDDGEYSDEGYIDDDI